MSALSISQSTVNVAKQLSHCMIKVKPDLEKIKNLFAEHAVIRIGETAFGRDEFILELGRAHLHNVKKIEGRGLETWNPVENSEGDVLWIYDGQQYRCGLGLNEKEEGWYRIHTEILLKFEKIFGEYKVTEYSFVKNNKSILVNRSPL